MYTFENRQNVLQHLLSQMLEEQIFVRAGSISQKFLLRTTLHPNLIFYVVEFNIDIYFNGFVIAFSSFFKF